MECVLGPEKGISGKSWRLGGTTLQISPFRHVRGDCGEEVTEDDPQAEPRQSEAPRPSPALGRYTLPTVPTVGPIFKDAALREQCVVETTWMVYVTEPPLSLCVNLRFWRWVQRSTRLWVAKTSLVCKFRCLLNLPPTNLEWSASFFHLSLPSVFGGQFQISPRKLLRL